MKQTWVALLLTSGVMLGASCGQASADERAGAAPATPNPQTDSHSPDLLGMNFENQAAGISLRLPAGLHRVVSTGAGDDLGQFGDAKRNWQLKLNRITRTVPTSLSTTTDNFGRSVPGLLDQTVEKLNRDLPACKILRNDLTNIRDGDPKIKANVGMIAVRYGAAGGHYLTQQAIIQASDRLFYLLALTTPASEVTGDNPPEDPGERQAVETFHQMLDTVRLLDTAKIRQEQDERLYHARALMLNLSNPQRLYEALVPQQWLRVMRHGKDIGYSYITERTASGIPRPLKRGEVNQGKSDSDLVKPGDGVLIGVRARSFDEPQVVSSDNQRHAGPVQVDTAEWMFVMPDRKLEDWSRLMLLADGTKDKDGNPLLRQLEEIGSSDVPITRAIDRNAEPGTALDPKQPPVLKLERYTLNVTDINESGAAEPVQRELPGFYLPQALSHLLPRLLPLERPKNYLFATYVPEVKELMLRYVEVGRVGDYTLGGRSFRAVPITDRLGWHGSVTTHYLSPEGKYLGAENKESGLLIQPVDAPTLLSIWKNANLTQPGGTERGGSHRATGASK